MVELKYYEKRDNGKNFRIIRKRDRKSNGFF